MNKGWSRKNITGRRKSMYRLGRKWHGSWALWPVYRQQEWCEVRVEREARLGPDRTVNTIGKDFDILILKAPWTISGQISILKRSPWMQYL